MHISTFIGGLSAICGLTLAQTTVTSPVIEADDFSVTGALEDLGVDVSQIPALESFTAIETRSTDKACAAACASLGFLFGSKVAAQDTTGYSNFTSSFWSVQQEEVQPRCIFRPTKNTEVSTAVLLSRLTGCEFAARSGGHAAFTGASSAPGGISIWFKDMNAVTLNADKTVASIEPGNNWLTTYTALEPYGLAVIGGRAASIGVGGFVLGGGISYHSNLYGWACDNVHSFEVVTASGLIVTASETSHADLYWALRGGGNNFGLVTKYNMYTIPSPKLYGGARTFLQTEFPEVINAWINVINNATIDGKAQQYVAFLRTQDMNLASAELTYVHNDPNPEIYKQYRSIPAISDTSSAKTLVEYVEYLESENPFGLREVYWPISAALDEKFANWVVDLFYSMISEVADVAGAQPVLIYQGITEAMLNNMKNHGGNALGLAGSSGPVHLLHISCWWTNEADDETIYAFVNKFMEKVIAEAKSVGVFNEYVYMNYASMFQDAVAGYGATNKAQLKNIAKKYDPREVYQKLQPGYFKLDGPPVTPSF
ncbi:CAZyme family AA7 [Penicillium roqueforti]|uniref:FAD-binding, type 2 n=1 Tax=Penicillium roqueforti (strain FM164) TaxID=1365484 RepID=W6Q0S0_PENRF|nr:CAZyme family AA7 [Penicillium roqueforti]CDM30148.1 FAD-binding, type 2 [Penicillium roqueforti FM164]KAF9249011.1 CAZyme family AA7 [Penicillium roqueforti]KAI1831790.1 CAZyme family AA7 [Penicillium roqueforti]KAI2669816.1 CAZyme family AA7 [Penicillium roqueforti]KAI2673605.1 CAZyme family AA7 [Penicillium roqueforti]